MEPISADTLRIIDANLNRTGEGLRVLEEVARLSLNDTELTQRLKNLRHDITQIDANLRPRLMNARDADGDVGAEMLAEGQDKSRNAHDIVTANARRVQESLRVLEEVARLPGLGLDTERYKNARFALYTIEKELIQKVGRQDKLAKLTGLYVIIDSARLRERSLKEVTAQVIKGGASVIQLRDKEHSQQELLTIAQEMRQICQEADVLFIVNDYLDIALATDADGLHVGPDDLPVATARQLLPGDKILGGSARTVARVQELAAAGADYLGVGAMFVTGTKDGAEVVGATRLKEIRQAVNIPLVAIGGINEGNIREIINAGASAYAVISAVMDADDAEKVTRRLADIIREKQDG